jgi:two-component system, NarL family, nitrate/nitrite response regulator NarL
MEEQSGIGTLRPRSRASVPAARAPENQIRIRVVIVSNVALYRDGLAALLGRIGKLDIVATVACPEEAAACVRDGAVDVVLMDLGAWNVGAAGKLLAAAPDARVVVLAAPEGAEDVIALAEAGVLGYVTREQSLADVADITESAARDEMACAPWIGTLLVRRVQALAADRPASTHRLTPRETTVLALVTDGLSNRQIAARLHIELTTVKNHVHDILRKLGAHTRAEAVALTALGYGAAHPRDA